MVKKIKTLSVFHKNLKLESSGEEVFEQDECLVSRSIYGPEHGLLLEETQYNTDGQAEQSMRYTYDASGFRIKEELLDGGGDVLEEHKFELDAEGRIEREFIYYADGSASRIEYTYNQLGRLVKKETFDDDGEMEIVESFEFEGGHLVRKAEVSAEGELISESLYTYDKDGQLEELLFQEPAEDYWYRKEYRYSEKGTREAVTTFNREGDPVERIVFEHDEQGRPVRVTEENRSQKNTLNMKYNERGDVIFQEEFDLNGELINRIERIFSDEGLLLESRVLVRNFQYNFSRNYSIRHEYSFYDANI